MTNTAQSSLAQRWGNWIRVPSAHPAGDGVIALGFRCHSPGLSPSPSFYRSAGLATTIVGLPLLLRATLRAARVALAPLEDAWPRLCKKGWDCRSPDAEVASRKRCLSTASTQAIRDRQA
jgi:hypothetical protein